MCERQLMCTPRVSEDRVLPSDNCNSDVTFSEPNWACPQELSQSCRTDQVQDHPCSSGFKGSEILYWSQNTQGGWVALSAPCKGILGEVFSG